MTFSTALLWSLLRSLVIAMAGLIVSVRLQQSLRLLSGQRAMFWWGLTLLPVFVPGLLIGYGYRNFALSLVHHPMWNEVLYALLVTLQVIPIGVLVLVCSPSPPVSASALHVRRLSALHLSPLEGRRTSQARQRLVSEWLRHHLFSLFPAGAVMFLLAFQESEVATLMQADGWTEWLFTRYVGGLTMATALQVLIIPVLVQGIVIMTTLSLVTVGTHQKSEVAQLAARSSSGDRWTVASFVGLALIALAGLPGTVVLRGTWQGFSVLSAHPTLLREIGIAVLFAITSGGLTWVLSGLVIHRLGGLGRMGIMAVLLPGLMGSLAMGMGVTGLVQRPPLVTLRDTPLPVVVAEVLFLLPRAVLIRLLVGQLRDSSAVYAARLLARSGSPIHQQASASLLWRLDVAGRIGGLLILCYWAYIELTLPSLLAPPGMTPAPVVLYNLMHYGQISGLSAMLFASMTTPVVLMALSWWGFRIVIHRLF
ncbi:MAG: hypothetical protein KDA86_15000 [Planctomycetaceae bacterium]|nr:hypothetical protein [Planctomycetaceae bacterium]